MNKEEFILGIENIIKYNGDIRQFIEDNFPEENEVVKFSLNDSFYCTVTEAGEKYGVRKGMKKGDRIRMQFWELSDISIPFGELPLKDCEFIRE
ncbi:MAG: hypothetical protein MJ204_02780 [Bacteroidales bacterium]|nr:hypothetical protein [Bacteroidales bacterium]MCQ2605453.1 hypothetical protein [Bacteroidales bacterium]